MSENNDLTILLTLWDRVPCTFRWMAYADKINMPFKVLIADGGADKSVPNVLGDRKNYPNVNYEYLRYSYDATPTHYYAKVLDALNRVETPFVVMADNDDFFVIDALRRSIDYLKNHPDFSSCRGIIGGLRIAGDPNYGEFSNVYGSDVSFVRRVYPDKPNFEETAVARVHNYCSSYRANWYDVFRTEQTRSSFEVLRELNTQDLILSQHVPMLLGVIAGKVQVEPYLYLVRQLEGLTSCDQLETRQNGDLFDRMLLDTWSNDFRGFVNAIAAAISRKDGIPLEEATNEVKQGYRTLMTPGILNCLSASVPLRRSVRITRKVISNIGPAGSVLQKIFPPIRSLTAGPANGYQFIPADQLSTTDKTFKQICDFVAAPPDSIERLPQTQSENSFN